MPCDQFFDLVAVHLFRLPIAFARYDNLLKIAVIPFDVDFLALENGEQLNGFLYDLGMGSKPVVALQIIQKRNQVGVHLDRSFDIVSHLQNLPSCSANALKYVPICAMIAVAPINPDGSPAPLAIWA
jgi:hypothetical protein